jgi:tRNA nucleotidyltransferase/poly(A) polymerase
LWLDLVNLRAEQHSQGSRIPDVMRIGTAEEGAFRRDLTINALFYNMQTELVEDWTGKGFADLRRGIVDTTLQPLTTLLDDPLPKRFTMSDESTRTAKTPQDVQALALKGVARRCGRRV